MSPAHAAETGSLFGLFARFRAARAGSISVMFALGMPAILGVAAMATDLGLVYLERRTLQAASDASAMAAASNPDAGATSIRTLLDAYGLQAASFVVTYGTYDDSPGIDRDKRFTPGPRDNGIRVEATLKAPVYFARIFAMESTAITVRSEAAMVPMVSLSAGSRLASVGPSLLNDVLNGLLGINLDLKVADYASLLSTKLQLGSLLNAIVEQGLVKDVTNLLVKDVLSQPIKLSVLLSLLAQQVDATGDLVAGSLLRKAAQQTVSANVFIKLDDILQLGAGVSNLGLAYPGPALQTNLSVLSLLNAVVHQDGIGTSLKSGVDLPGVLSTSVELLIGEVGKAAKVLSISDSLPSISTDQVRVRIQAKTLGLLAAIANVNLPIEVVAAGGTAKVVSVTCNSDPLQREIRVEAQPGIVRLSIGKFVGPLKSAGVNDVLKDEEIAKVLGLLGVLAHANITAKQDTPITLVFKGKEIGNGTVKTAKTTTIVQSLVTSLLTQTKLSIPGVSLNLDALLSPIFDVLGKLMKPVDDLLNGVLAAVGVSLGEMDVRVDDLVCGNPKIVG